MKRLFMILTVVSIPLGFFAFWHSSAAVEDPIAAVGGKRFNEGTIAPTFNLENLDGERLTLENFRGKVVLIDFWATW